MNIEALKAIALRATKGANLRISWCRPVKTKKDCTDVIIKSVQTVGRIGISYDNQKAVKDKRLSGQLPAESQPIWNGAGEWSVYPYIIRHKKTGQNYLRLYRGSNNPENTKVKFYRNGNDVELSEIENDVLASEKRASHDSDCITCRTESITNLSWG